MKKIILILKGILLYSTTLLSILFIDSLDSIYDLSYLIIGIGTIAALICLCCKVITEAEIYKLTFTDKFKDA
jgi:hypothetical protein